MMVNALASFALIHGAAACDGSDFTVDRNGQLCSGLANKPASNADECMQQACASDAEVWQWCGDADHCGASAGGCWVGTANNCAPFGTWTSKSRPAVPAPAPPPRGTWKRTQCGSPASSADIPTKWGLEVSADKQPLTAYPRPQMVRGTAVTNLERLRDTGDENTWINLNGLWEWEPASSEEPRFGDHLASSILVPFPVEACLSGVAPKKSAWLSKTMWYRQTFQRPTWKGSAQRTLLHFGAVDWQTTVYVNGVKLGSHTGGYDSFSFDLTPHLVDASNELLVYVFDPSDSGAQPNGKQRASAIEAPGSDTYTPSSGIWQTVWLEGVPEQHVESLEIDQASLDTVTFTIKGADGADVEYSITDGDQVVGSGKGKAGTAISHKLSNPKLWSAVSPHLYDLHVSLGDDSIIAYFGLRTFQLGGGPDKIIPAEPFTENFDRPFGDHAACGKSGCSMDDSATHFDCEKMCNTTSGCVGYVFAPAACDDQWGAICWLKDTAVGGYSRGCRESRLMERTEYSTKPVFNGKYTFLAGFLDQSWWPDGQYTAPSDEALAFDLEATKMYGLNMIRLHQKVNPERWYYHADRLGLIVFQDMPQKYGGATADTIPLFVEDAKAMIKGKKSHPSIVQWTPFNEADCFGVFNTPPHDLTGITNLFKELDPTRLVDTASGEWVADSDKHVGDVYDIHSYPEPGDVLPAHNMYAMVGEFGGIGAFIPGKEWVPKGCFTYLPAATPSEQAGKYAEMALTLESRVDHISAAVYTQTTDLELECDGFLTYDRSNKFSDADTQVIRDANQAIIIASERLAVSTLV